MRRAVAGSSSRQGRIFALRQGLTLQRHASLSVQDVSVLPSFMQEAFLLSLCIPEMQRVQHATRKWVCAGAGE